jgi:hypothetical protein
MKKLFILVIVILFGGLVSCSCECVGPNDNDPSNKICKTEYENLNGQGTWGNYESNVKASGYVCK